MSAIAVARSSLTTSLARYSRSIGLWLLLLSGPVGARFMIARDDGTGIQIAVGNHLPVMTSAMLGMSLGIVVSTLLLPIGFIYLRANVTRRQPWQIEEVTIARSIAIAFGRFGADVAVLFAMLTALTLAGWLLGWIIVWGPLNVAQLSWCLWLVAAPALMGLAAVHRLMDAMPWTRRALGETLFFFLWIASISLPAAVDGQASSFRSNMYDFAGFVRPLVGAAPSKDNDFAIGSTDVAPGRVPLDVLSGVRAPGYIASRVAWMGIALTLAALAGLLYRPHAPPKRPRATALLAKLLSHGPPPAALPGAPPAGFVRAAYAQLVAAEFRLIGSGRLFRLLAIGAAILGLFGDYRHIGAPGALLLLIFGMCAHAGRSEAKGLLLLTQTAVVIPGARRLAFVAAALGWAMLLAAPAAIVRMSPQPLLTMVMAGGAAAIVAIVLATLTRSSFAPRLVLLVMWYGYLSS